MERHRLWYSAKVSIACSSAVEQGGPSCATALRISSLLTRPPLPEIKLVSIETAVLLEIGAFTMTLPLRSVQRNAFAMVARTDAAALLSGSSIIICNTTWYRSSRSKLSHDLGLAIELGPSALSLKTRRHKLCTVSPGACQLRSLVTVFT